MKTQTNNEVHSGVVHKSVLVNEVNKYLDVEKLAHLKSQAKIIDATVGAGGHAAEFVRRGIFVLGLDTDEEMLQFAENKLRQACPVPKSNFRDQFKLVHANFTDIDKVAKTEGITKANGVLFDLGVSSYQLTSKTRGLSYSNPQATLDMRLNKSSGIMAKDILNLSSYENLVKMFEATCDYKKARKIAGEVGQFRKTKNFETVEDFLSVCGGFLPRTDKKIDPATLPFMALRIAVNNELENIKEALPKAFDLLEVGGRLCVISFHSGEDKLVKFFMKSCQEKSEGKVITKKPVLPMGKEISENRRSRSAKLRVIEKI